MVAEPRQAVSSDSSWERNFTVNGAEDGLQGYRFEPERERMASESSGARETEVLSDAGVDLAQAIGGRLASPDSVAQTA